MSAIPHSVQCPGCNAPMLAEEFDRAPTGTLTIDICYPCHAIWFDQLESSQLAPGGVIALFKKIHAHRGDGHKALPQSMQCPRCTHTLKLTNDLQKAGRLSYHRCASGHGRLTTFFQFLREKQFVRNLNAKELSEIKAKVAEVRCSGCGGPINIKTDTACGYCRAPISVLDADAVEKALRTLADKDAQGSDPGRIAVALHDAMVVQPARARRRDKESYEVASPMRTTAATVDLVAEGISMLARMFWH